MCSSNVKLGLFMAKLSTEMRTLSHRASSDHLAYLLVISMGTGRLAQQGSTSDRYLSQLPLS